MVKHKNKKIEETKVNQKKPLKWESKNAYPNLAIKRKRVKGEVGERLAKEYSLYKRGD